MIQPFESALRWWPLCELIMLGPDVGIRQGERTSALLHTPDILRLIPRSSVKGASDVSGCGRRKFGQQRAGGASVVRCGSGGGRCRLLQSRKQPLIPRQHTEASGLCIAHPRTASFAMRHASRQCHIRCGTIVRSSR